jgi:drug/metabolite transporter (DMT)-like permease
VQSTLLVLLSALLHAAWNVGLKREREKDAATVVVVALAIVVGAALAAVRLLEGRDPFPAPSGIAWSLSSGVAEAGYIWTLARALEAGPLGPTYALARGGSVVLAWPAALLLFRERVDATSLLAALAVVAGLVLVGGQGALSARAVGLSLASAAFVAAYHLAYKGALATGAEPGAVVTLSLSLAVAANVAMLPPSRRGVALQLLRTRGLALVACGLASGLSFLLALFALERGGAAWVLTLRQSSVIFAAILATWLGDRPNGRQVVGFVAIVLGAVLLGFPVAPAGTR